MKASDLKQLLALLTPSLSESNFAPILGKVCFVEGAVYTYNDVVATVYEWDHGLGEFAVDGKAFAALIANFGDDEVTMKLDKGVLNIAAGTAKAKLPIASKDELVFSYPDLDKAVVATMGTTDAERDRLAEALDAVATSSVNKIYESVVFSNDGAKLTATTTDGTKLIHAVVGKMDAPTKAKQNWIVPKLAVKQMLAMLAADSKLKELKLHFGKETAIAEGENTGVVSSLIQEDVPDLLGYIQFEPVAKIMNWKSDKLLRALNIAAVMQDSYSNLLHIGVDNKGFKLASRGKDGEATDQVPLTDVKITEEVNFSIDPALVRNAFKFESLNETSPLEIGPHCLTFGKKEGFIYGIAFEQSE